MANLDDPKALTRLDTQEMAQHITELPEQIEAAAESFRSVSIPTHYIQARNIVILGMGDSATAGELVADLAQESSSVPIVIQRDYSMPGFVNKDTLVIGISYSGGTEETLEGFRQAAARGAKLIAVSSGGQIGSLARKFQIPLFSIDYGAQSRAAFGYLFVAAATILAKLRHLNLGLTELAETAVLMKALRSRIGLDVPANDNSAKTLATKLKDRIPLVIGAGPMATVAKRWKTQFNLNGKLPAIAEAMPELSHNLVAGVERHHKQRDALYPILLQSQFGQPRNSLRMNLLAKQFSAARLPFEQVSLPTAGTPISEALQLTYLGDFVTLYGALLSSIDPTETRMITALKKDLEAVDWNHGA